MSIRDLKLSDLVALEKDAKFPLPKLADNSYIIKKSFELDDELIASFWVKLTSEASIVLNKDSSRLTAARALKEIEEFLMQELRKVGINDIHLFIKDNDAFNHFLKKHFSFTELNEKALFRRF